MYTKDSTGKYDVLHDDPKIFRLAVIHSTNFKAEKTVKELDLDGAVPFGIDEVQPTGRRYQKIVTMCDLSHEHQGQHTLTYLLTMLTPDGRIVNLS